MGDGGRPVRGGRPLSRPEPSTDDWLDRWFADGSAIWDAFVVIFYLPVILGALLWLFTAGGAWLVWDRLLGDQVVVDTAVGTVVGFGLVVASRLGERSAVGARASAVLGDFFGHVSWPALVVVAATSALGEELLFRGVLQPIAGWVPASILFAAVHVPFRKELWPWTVQALLHGLLFGWAYELSGALVVPIVAHTVFSASQLVHWKLSASS